ncbi:hypothetical protein PFISCL1PPCAC_24079, partial [Pristionchus fissidentatus]
NGLSYFRLEMDLKVDPDQGEAEYKSELARIEEWRKKSSDYSGHSNDALGSVLTKGFEAMAAAIKPDSSFNDIQRALTSFNYERLVSLQFDQSRDVVIRDLFYGAMECLHHSLQVLTAHKKECRRIPIGDFSQENPRSVPSEVPVTTSVPVSTTPVRIPLPSTRNPKIEMDDDDARPTLSHHSLCHSTFACVNGGQSIHAESSNEDVKATRVTASSRRKFERKNRGRRTHSSVVRAVKEEPIETDINGNVENDQVKKDGMKIENEENVSHSMSQEGRVDAQTMTSEEVEKEGEEEEEEEE